MEDSHCKGTVNLAEVESVSLVPPAPGAPKKVDDKAFFEVSGLGVLFAAASRKLKLEAGETITCGYSDRTKKVLTLAPRSTGIPLTVFALTKLCLPADERD